ncbi:hypothetical protein BK673_19595 [Pseudomonas fluorescens]|uniref:Uncharacterized protein n=2 Tax=Pseudomonas fluorescens TaxID=294 RepID=A0A423P2G7_PSEFL|nr:hypothetical protein BK673_19595 [Pseudomonas fluorescens]
MLVTSYIEIMIKLDPEINRTAIRAIKTMSGTPEKTSIMRVTIGSHVAVVTGGNRLQEGDITEIDDDKFTMKRSNGTKIDILYKDVNGFCFDDVEPGFGNIGGSLFVLAPRGQSGQVINIKHIVPMRLPLKPVGSCWAMGPDEVLMLLPPPLYGPTGPYTMIDLETETELEFIRDISGNHDFFFVDSNGSVP